MQIKVSPIVHTLCVTVVLLFGVSTSGPVSAQEVPAYGAPHPNAPPQLSQFAFLIGSWTADGRVLNADGTWRASTTTRWTGRYILDGHAIAGVYQRQASDGTLTTSFLDFRFYDRAEERWIVEYLNLGAVEFGSQGQEAVGGVQIGESSVTVMTGPDDVDGVSFITRETFTDITPERFTYRRALSVDDGESWTQVEVAELSRIEHEDRPGR